MSLGFWSRKDIYEPLRQNRWLVSFNLQNEEEIIASAKECSIPEYDVSFTEHRLMTQTFKLPGLLKWKPVTLKFVSMVGANNTIDNQIETILRTIFDYKSFYDYSSSFESKDAKKAGFDKSETFLSETLNTNGPYHQSITNGHEDSNVLEIRQLDENGNTVQSWKLFNWFISSVSRGTMSYSSEDILDITLTVQYDFALLSDVEFYSKIREKQAKQKIIEDALQEEIDKLRSPEKTIPKTNKESNSDSPTKPADVQASVAREALAATVVSNNIQATNDTINGKPVTRQQYLDSQSNPFADLEKSKPVGSGVSTEKLAAATAAVEAQIRSENPAEAARTDQLLESGTNRQSVVDNRTADQRGLVNNERPQSPPLETKTDTDMDSRPAKNTNVVSSSGTDSEVKVNVRYSTVQSPSIEADKKAVEVNPNVDTSTRQVTKNNDGTLMYTYKTKKA